MTKVITGRIEKGKIIPQKQIPIGVRNAEVKIFIFHQSKSKNSYFGKGKGIFKDGLKFQKKVRQEWK